MTPVLRSERRTKWIRSSLPSTTRPSTVTGARPARKAATFFLSSSCIATGILAAALQPQVHERLEVLRSHDDLLADLEGVHVEEDAQRRVVLAAEVAVAEVAVPRVLPVEFDDLLGAEVAEVRDGQPLVIEHEADVGDGHAASLRHGGTHAEGGGSGRQRVAEHRVDHHLGSIGGRRQRLAGHLVANDPPACLELRDPSEERLAVRADDPILAEEPGEPLRMITRVVSELLVDRIRHEPTERLDVAHADLELDAHLAVSHMDLDDRRGLHRARDHDGVAVHDGIAGRGQQAREGEGGAAPCHGTITSMRTLCANSLRS